MLDTTLGAILCCQSPALFLLAVVLLLCYLIRRKKHKVTAVLDLILCIVCIAGGVALYFLGMSLGHFTIKDFYQIRPSGWIGLAVAALIAVITLIRGVVRSAGAHRTARAAARAENARREEEQKRREEEQKRREEEQRQREAMEQELAEARAAAALAAARADRAEAAAVPPESAATQPENAAEAAAETPGDRE